MATDRALASGNRLPHAVGEPIHFRPLSGLALRWYVGRHPRGTIGPWPWPSGPRKLRVRRYLDSKLLLTR